MTSGPKAVLREAAMWLAALSVVFFSVFYFDDLQDRLSPENWPAAIRQVLHVQDAPDTPAETTFARQVTIPASKGGHYYANAHINGTPIPILIDTGATYLSLSYEDARKVGVYVLDQDFTHRAHTANGVARIAKRTVDQVRLGDITLYDIEATVAEPGTKHITLLGMSFIGRLQSATIERGHLVLTE